MSAPADPHALERALGEDLQQATVDRLQVVHRAPRAHGRSATSTLVDPVLVRRDEFVDDLAGPLVAAFQVPRERLHDARIGFEKHVMDPDLETSQVLPRREHQPLVVRDDQANGLAQMLGQVRR